MKIIYVMPIDLTTEVAATQRVLTIAKALTLIGHEVGFIDICATKKREYEWNGYPVYSVKRSSRLYDSVKFKIDRNDVVSALDQISDVDMIVAYNYPGIALRRIVKICHKKGIKCVADVADWPDGKRSLIHKILMWIDISVRMYYTHKRMDGLIVISEYLSKFYSTCLQVKLPPMIDAVDEKWEAGAVQYGDCVHISNVTTAGPDKENLIGLLNMLSECKGTIPTKFHLTVMGMTEEYFNRVHQATIPENIRDFVTFAGHVPHKEAIKKIKESDYFAFFRESNRINEAGFPTKFVEAVSCGTPVITTRTSDLANYLRDGETGYFVETAEDLCKALTQTKEARQLMHKVCQNNKEFDYHLYVDRISDFLDYVMEGKK